VSGLHWFRVELTDDGKVVSCRVADSGDKGARLVHYVQAVDAAAAAKAALNARAAELLAARRAAYKAQGLCACGRKRNRPGSERCSACYERHLVHEARQKRKRKGEKLEPLDRRAVLQQRKEAERREAIASATPTAQRLSLLLEVQKAWQDSPTNGAFTSWLMREIERAGGKRRAG
jgi:hypothetical protein